MAAFVAWETLVAHPFETIDSNFVVLPVVVAAETFVAVTAVASVVSAVEVVDLVVVVAAAKFVGAADPTIGDCYPEFEIDLTLQLR